jgi:hypothetical protein
MAGEQKRSGQESGAGQSGLEQPVEPTAEALQAGHEESLAAAHDLVTKVEQAERAEEHPVPSQAKADETAASGI